jgi:hypothetical protein
MSYYRRVSPGERTFHLARETDPFSRKYIQVVIEGEGELKLSKWQAAIEQLAKVHVGSHLTLKGHLGFTRWDSEGAVPTVREIAPGWDGYDFDAPFLFPPPIDIRKDPLGEVVLLQGPVPRVLMRVHHAVMDGVGALLLARDVFRLLRSEDPLGSNSNASEIDVWRAHNFGKRKMPSVSKDAITPFGSTHGRLETKPVWERRSLPQHGIRIIPKLALMLAERAWREGEGTFRIALFVNLRRHLGDGQITLANCSGMILFEVERTDTEDTVTRKIFDKMRARAYLDMTPYVSVVHWLPAGLFKPGLSTIQRQYQRGTFNASAYLTHIGSFSPDQYSYSDFRARRLIPIPPSDATAPLNLAICESDETVEIVATAPAALAGEGKLESLMDDLQAKLVPKKMPQNSAHA